MSDFMSGWAVELRRHLGIANKPPLGRLTIEHPQKMAVLKTGDDKPVGVGILPDAKQAIVFYPDAEKLLKDVPGAFDRINELALAEREAGRFVTPEKY